MRELLTVITILALCLTFNIRAQEIEIQDPVSGTYVTVSDTTIVVNTGAGQFNNPEESGPAANFLWRIWERLYRQDLFALVVRDIDETGYYYRLLQPTATVPAINFIADKFETDNPTLDTIVDLVIFDKATGTRAPYMYVNFNQVKQP